MNEAYRAIIFFNEEGMRAWDLPAMVGMVQRIWWRDANDHV